MIYYVQVKHEHGPIKIGYSQYAKTRIVDIQRTIPYTLHTRNITHGTQQHEKIIHRLHTSCRIRHEWFYATHKLLNFITYADDYMPDICQLDKSTHKTNYTPSAWYTVEELARELGKNPDDIMKWTDTSKRYHQASNGLKSFERASFPVFFKDDVEKWKIECAM